MCGRINQDERAFQSEQRWQNRLNKSERQFNIGIGMRAFVYHKLNGVETHEYIKFGFNRGGRLNFNARIEGFHNKENRSNYDGTFGLATNPNYKDLVDTHRCIIPVSSFIEGPEVEKLSKPFDIRVSFYKVFALAGIIGTDEKTGELGFSIITTWPNEIIKTVIGHHRSPYILSDEEEYTDWVDPYVPFDLVSQVIKPLNNDSMIIHELSPEYKSPKFTMPINV